MNLEYTLTTGLSLNTHSGCMSVGYVLFSVFGTSSHVTNHILSLFIVISVRTGFVKPVLLLDVCMSDQSLGRIIWYFNWCIFALIMIRNPRFQVYSVTGVGFSIQIYKIGFVSEFLTTNCRFPNSIMMS